jgi:hypothetical protein
VTKKTQNTRKRNPLMKTAMNPPPRLSSSSCPPFAFSSVAAEEPLGRWVRYPQVLPTLGETMGETVGDGKVGRTGYRKHSVIREDTGEDYVEEEWETLGETLGGRLGWRVQETLVETMGETLVKTMGETLVKTMGETLVETGKVQETLVETV